MNDSLVVMFAEDAAQLIEALERGIASLPGNASQDDMAEAFRAAHTIKGNAGIVGFASVAALARSMEALLSCICKGQVAPDEAAAALLQKALGALKDLISGHLAGGQPKPPSELIDELTACLEAK